MDTATLRHTFASRIRKLREGKLNQGEFADSVGISRGAMSYYEQEARTPDIGVLRAICEKYKISADYLLGLIPDTNHAVSDVCLETGLFPQAARRLRLLRQIDEIDIESVVTVLERFDEDMEEAMRLLAFTSATPMVNLLLMTDEGLKMMNLLSAIIFGAELHTGSDTKPFFKFMSNHRHIQIEYPLQNITAALWVNVQNEAEKLKEKIDAANSEQPV